jgi:hypothetical protein
MSQSILPQPAIAADFRHAIDAPNEFAYRPVPVLVPVTVVLGLCSILSLFSLFGVAVALFGTVLGAVCIRQIHRSGGALGGKIPAFVGFFVSLVFFVSGSSLFAYAVATEVPEGYRRTSFAQDISRKGFVTTNGVPRIHPEVAALNKQPVFLKGYMYPTGQTEGLTSFVLVKDNQQCCFGGQPAITDMILVEMEKGKTATYTPELVAVAGVFRTQNSSQGPADLMPVYSMDAVYCDRAKTGF